MPDFVPLSREELKEYVGWQIDPPLLTALHNLDRWEAAQRERDMAWDEAEHQAERRKAAEREVARLREALNLALMHLEDPRAIASVRYLSNAETEPPHPIKEKESCDSE